MESAWQDVRDAIRTLRRAPVFSVIVVGILALGIGANAAIFSLVDRVILRPLPVKDPQQLVELLMKYPLDPRLNMFSWRAYEHFRDENHVFSELTGVAQRQMPIRRDDADVETVYVEAVLGTLFPTLGIQPALGRLIGPADLAPGAAPVADVSWSYWQTRFNGSPSVLGTHITVNGVSASIVGVVPRAYVGLQAGIATAVWIPMPRAAPTFSLLARLKPGVSIDQARAEMRVLDRWRIEDLAKTSHDPVWLQTRIYVEPAAAGLGALREVFGMPLRALMAGVALLLLIACTNVASMLLARGAARARELAVRVSLGAGRMRLARQVLAESLLLAGAGSALGVVLAYGGAGALVRIMNSGRTPLGTPQNIQLQIAPDLRILLFTAAVALITGVLFGLAPAWSAFRTAPIASLRDVGIAGERRSRRLFGKGLVAAQVALSLALLSAAGLFAGHLSNLRNVDLGFQRDGVLLVTLDPQGSGYERSQLADVYRELLRRLESLPGVRSATLAGVTPMDGGVGSRFARVEGYQEKDRDRRRLWLNPVAPKYFETLGTPLLAGRDFQFEDAGHPRVAIVNQAMARHYFGNASPLGRHFTFDGDTVSYEIVGLVGDAKYADLHDPAPRTVYLDAFQGGSVPSRFALWTSVPPASVAGDVRRLVQDSLKTIKVTKITTLADQMDATLVPERAVASLSGVFGALGAILAALGLYGLLAYSVTRRVKEIGVRMALGATERDVVRMVLRDAFGLVCAGLIIGLPLSLWARRVAASLVPNLPSGTGMLMAAAAAAMIVVALAAAYVPARRAARVRPMDALRQW